MPMELVLCAINYLSGPSVVMIVVILFPFSFALVLSYKLLQYITT